MAATRLILEPLLMVLMGAGSTRPLRLAVVLNCRQGRDPGLAWRRFVWRFHKFGNAFRNGLRSTTRTTAICAHVKDTSCCMQVPPHRT